MINNKTATEQFAQLVEDYGDECDLWGASSTRACEMFGLIRDKYEQAIAATLGSGTLTAEQVRGELNKLIIELDHLDFTVDSPASDMTLGEYEQEREKLLDEFMQAIAATLGSERENGWYLRSDGYMTSECSYQRIEAMKGNRALDNHQKLVFVKYMGGEEKDSRVYAPHPGTCSMKELTRYDGSDPHYRCNACGSENNEDELPAYCPRCGKMVEQ